jgi:hypothetical protein
MAGIRSIDWQYDVSVAGDLGDHLGDIEAAELLAADSGRRSGGC